mmetsp:Transcript_26603/g.68284  ORF Transcript_26603/g.68284 Transcript_26603/m.68284 type:complete len:252 (-) Transcript_26603:493-1248(-)
MRQSVIFSLYLLVSAAVCLARAEEEIEGGVRKLSPAELEARSLFRRTRATTFFGVDNDGWTITKGGKTSEVMYGRFSGFDQGNVTWYFQSGPNFAGDFGQLYNGLLTFTLGHSEFNSMGQGVPHAYDVILRSDDLDISIGTKDVVEEWVPTRRCEVPLREDKWEHIESGEPVSLLEFAEVLSSLTYVRIRGGYYVGHEHTWISTVKLIEPKDPFRLPDEKKNPELVELCAFLGLSDGVCDPYLAHLTEVVM